MPSIDKERQRAYNKKYYEEHRKERRISKKDQWRASRKKWHDANKEKVRTYQRKRKYGLSEFDCNRLHDLQEWACAICLQTPEELDKRTGRMRAKDLHTDHSHRTGKVRGLLCRECNLGLGKFQDRPDLLVAAAVYLVRYNAALLPS